MPNYPAKFQINPIYGFWEKLDESFRTDGRTYVRTCVKLNAPDESSRGHKNNDDNGKLGSDRSENRLGRMGHHIRSCYKISTHSHERFPRKAWRKYWYLRTAKQEVGVRQVRNLLRIYSTSYQTTLPSVKSFPFTVSEKSLTKVRTDGHE